MRFGWRYIAPVLLWTAIAPAARHAYGASPTSTESEENILFKEGAALEEVGDLQGALRKFSRLYEIGKSAESLHHIIWLELTLGMKIEAHGSLLTYLTHLKIPATYKQFAAKQLQELEQALAELRVRVDPPDASVQIDDSPAGLPAWLYPGQYVISVNAQGYEPVRQRIDLKAGERTEFTLLLRPLKVQPTERSSPQPHAPSGQTRRRAAPPSSSAVFSGRRLSIMTLGLGASALATGAIFGIRAIGRRAQADARCVDVPAEAGGAPIRCEPEGLRLYHEAQSAAMAANGLFIVGVSIAGAASAYWGWSAAAEPVHKVARTPPLLPAARLYAGASVAVGGASIMLGGVW